MISVFFLVFAALCVPCWLAARAWYAASESFSESVIVFLSAMLSAVALISLVTYH